jgi:hypothetical protein
LTGAHDRPMLSFTLPPATTGTSTSLGAPEMRIPWLKDALANREGRKPPGAWSRNAHLLS